ncbi:MAG: hypothetical protein HOC93_07340 [Phycisphaerae bacterium]|jgi:enediyne biosynthesis protein E4|nr:hypothetical protein [Phycisphaerae bacterium]
MKKLNTALSLTAAVVLTTQYVDASVNSVWEDVTTSLLSGEGHENHRGSSWCDFDNDGLLDLYSVHFGVFDPDGIYVGSANQLLRNTGDGVFEDATTEELEAYSGLSHHPAWADIDNDGLPDIFISQSSNSGTENSILLHQDSVGVFSDMTNGDPLQLDGLLPRGIAWQDINSDGLIDLLVAVSEGDSKQNRMMINEGNGIFTRDVLLFSQEFKESRSIGWCDYNNDGLSDVYIANGAEDHCDESRRTNQLFKNLGDGLWEDVALAAGVAEIGHARGQAWGDINNDGHMDLFVGNQKGSDTGGGHNHLFKNNGDGTFSDITISAGLYASFRTRCVSMADYDNDGYLDIYVVNFGSALPPNHLFRNNGDNTFTEVADGSHAVGGVFNGASASWADYDNDGWVDIYLVGGSIDAPGVGMNKLLRNANQNGNHWLEVELCGTVSNRSAIGSRVTVTHINDQGFVSQMRDVQSGTGYNSQNMMRAHFGLGSSDTVLNISIRWPSGIEQNVAGVSADQLIRVVEDENVFAFDCNRNCVDDSVDIADGTSEDVNNNGIPDECECIADLDGDGSVNVADLLTIIDNWGESSSHGDLDGDHFVGIQDLLLLIGLWGSC